MRPSTKGILHFAISTLIDEQPVDAIWVSIKLWDECGYAVPQDEAYAALLEMAKLEMLRSKESTTADYGNHVFWRS